MKASLVKQELFSALADDQLGPKACASLLDACKLDDSAADGWRIYHLIGEQLRMPASLDMPVSMEAELAFVRRLNKRLAGEAVTAHAPLRVDAGPPVPVVPSRQSAGQSANDSSFRWKLVAGVASLAAVAAIAWSAFGLQALFSNLSARGLL